MRQWLPLVVAPLLLLLLLLLQLQCDSAPTSVDPDEAKVDLDGDIILGGLFPIHSSAESPETKCGNIDSQRGIQRMEAMLFTLLQINSRGDLLRYGANKIKLGGLLYDTCSKDTHALERALQFVKNSLSHEYDTGFVCEFPNGTRSPAKRVTVGSSRDRNQRKSLNVKKPIRGVVGGAYSQVSVQVANLLRLVQIPQISYASTSAALSKKSRFDFFARTLPPDTQQAKALADIVDFFNWTYVSTVFSKGEYGEGGIQRFEEEVMKAGICIAERLRINSEPTKEELDTIVQNLAKQKLARVVVTFTREEHTVKLLDAVRRANITDHFVWISADGWGKSNLPVANNSLVAMGAITLEISTSEIPDFNRYFTQLQPGSPRLDSGNSTFTNPFFDEFWQHEFSCDLIDRSGDNADAAKQCDDSMRISSTSFKQEPKVQFVHDAVYTFAHGLQKVMKLVCKQQPISADTKATGLFQSCVRNITNFPGKRFYEILISEANFFVNTANRSVQFTKDGDGIGVYKIYNYARSSDQAAASAATADYWPIGEWRKDRGLTWRPDAQIRWSGTTSEQPMSRCSEECRIGQKKVRSNKGTSKDHCCWTCVDCLTHQRVSDSGDACVDCDVDEGPAADRMSCVPLQTKHIEWSSWYAIFPMILSCLGIFFTCFVIATFVKFNETPLVKASGRELSYLLLVGCLMCYMMTFLLIMKPKPATCALQRVGIGLGFAVIYSSLLTKTNRIARIFEAASRSAKRPPFISPRSQLLIAGALISVQLVCTAIWLLLNHPGTRIFHPQRLEAILRCRIDDKSFLLSLFYNMILIMVCTFYAIKTRRIPENFNESKFIGFTMYTTCIIWLAFVPLYFGTHSSFEVQITTQCVSISLSATVAMVCLFTPKLYIIFLQPEKNIRRLTMHSNQYKKQPSSSAGSYTNHRETSIEGDSCSTTRLPPQLYGRGDDGCAERTLANVNATAEDSSGQESDDEDSEFHERVGLRPSTEPAITISQRTPSTNQGRRASNKEVAEVSPESDSANFEYEDGFV